MSTHICLCSTCGQELRCLKTGFSIQLPYETVGIHHQADMYGCEQCRTFITVMNPNGFPSNGTADCIITQHKAYYHESLFQMWDRHYAHWNMRDVLPSQYQAP